MSGPKKSNDILHRLDKENARRGGINAGKLLGSPPEGFRRWPWWQRWVIIGAIVVVFALYLVFHL